MVDNLLAGDYFPLKKQILSRYTTFFKSLFSSASKEVRHLVRIVSREARSTVYKNVKLIEEISGFSPWDHDKAKIQENFPKATVPENNEWRLPPHAEENVRDKDGEGKADGRHQNSKQND